MRVDSAKQPNKTQDQKPDQKLEDFPKQQSLIAVLKNPELRKKLEDKVGGELVAKLDKIFNAQPPGVPPVQQPPPQASPQGPSQGPQQA